MTGDGRGLLYPAAMPTLHRRLAPERVSSLVRWFWIPEWNIVPDRVSRQELLAFPACNLAVEPTLVGLAGPTTRRSHRDLTGRGWTVGALLRPAAVPHLTTDPHALRDRYQSLAMPDLHRAVATAMTGQGEGDLRRARAVEAFTDWLVATLPPPDADGLLTNALAELVDGDPTVLQVEDAASRLNVSARTLQRLARRHVGLSPGEMIRRRRLQEAAERLRTDPDADLATVAAEFGYADQAHLSRDFRAVLGLTPSSYRASCLTVD
jgi:AraC-like DNA-binding protein